MIDVHVRIVVGMFACYKHMRTWEVKFLELPTITSAFI